MKKELKFEIIDAKTLQEAIRILLKKKLRPATMKEVWDLREKKLIPMQWYDTGTCLKNGVLRDVTIKELENINEEYSQGLRLAGLGRLGSNSGFLYGYFLLLDDNFGRLVGVVPEAHHRKKKKVSR